MQSGPKLKLAIMEDALFMPHDDNTPKLALTVTNRGDAPTTVTNMIMFTYGNWWNRLRRKPTMTAIANPRSVGNPSQIPTEIQVNRSWTGIMHYGENGEELRENELTFVGVFASHRDHEYLIHVRPKSKINRPRLEGAINGDLS